MKIVMHRVVVIGNAAGGKSTMSKKLSVSQGLPLYTVDKFQWKPDMTHIPQRELEQPLRTLTEREHWIIDGWGPWELIEERFEKADTIILIDHPVWIHFWWAFKRLVKAIFSPKRGNYNLIVVAGRFLKIIWMIHKKARPRLLNLVDAYREDKRVYHIKSPRTLKDFELRHC
ncbi:flagellar protein FlaR [candidate division CSSED10-310 bacterium]|uniref:Flagellar protein FlaR n=1 Tax=candidate division CSSED10-310 bacterium TaxID=2855610 RepID=A0ABV6YQZ4_UNCC1